LADVIRWRQQSKTADTIDGAFRPMALRTCNHVIRQMQKAHDDVMTARNKMIGTQAKVGAENVCSWMLCLFSAAAAAKIRQLARHRANHAATMNQLRVLDRDVVRPIMDRILRGRMESYPSLVRTLEEVVTPCTHERPVVGIQLEGVQSMLVRALLGFGSE